MIYLPGEIAKSYADTGKKKVEMDVCKLILLGIMAGMFIALAAVAANTAACTASSPSVAKLLAGVVFPAGLVMVVAAGGELFTGNCLIILSVLEKKTTLVKMLRCWIIVYISNFAGALLIAYAVQAGNQLDLFSGALAVTTIRTAAAKTALSFEVAFTLGILCNFLVCIAVWCAMAGPSLTDKAVGIFFPIMLFVVAGFEHSVANMYYIPAGLFAVQNWSWAAAATNAGVDFSGLTWGSFFLDNLVPVTLGNIVGGVLVGWMYWLVYLKKRPEA